jgi:hypothetical protein
MSNILRLEVDNPNVDIELTSVEDSFMILNAGVDETSPPDDSAPASEESQSESSDSSFLDIDLDDEIEDEEIDTTESIELDEHQVNQELEEVSSYMVRVIPKLHYKILSL